MNRQVLGRYRLLAEIGAGGMGIVYRARDERLGRDVAVKVIQKGLLSDVQARRRFRQEALLISRLNHPNVGTVYDFDSDDNLDFLIMEYIPGESLDERLKKGSLDEPEALSLGVQLLKGLAAAHQAGLIHRDLKPGNLRVTPDGRLKILDFGLAKLVHASPETFFSTTAVLTQDGAVPGTFPYMAPEQLRGLAADERTDLYAVGVVLYELVTGRRPFIDHNRANLIDAILNRIPEPPRRLNPRLTPGFEQAILRNLEKEPLHRFQTATELAERLEALMHPALSRMSPSWERFGSKEMLIGIVTGGLLLLAVFDPGELRKKWFGPRSEGMQALVILPLLNQSGDPEDAYFVDGLTDELTANLAQISTLKVISRNSASLYRDTKKRSPEIARELNVDVVIEGSVHHTSNRVRITVGMIAAKEDRQIWAETYEREEKDILALQDEVVMDIAARVHAKLTPGEQTRLQTSQPVDPRAYRACLRGRQALEEYTEEGSLKAREFFKQALQFDPEYAPAYAGIADSYYAVSNIWSAPNDVIPLARAAATKALELNPESSEGHSSLALIKTVFDWDWKGAETEFKKAIELNPNLASVHLHYAYFLTAMGREDEAIREYSAALDLDPLSVVVSALFGWSYLFSRGYAEGIAQLQKALLIDPNNYYPRPFLGVIQAESGDTEAGIRELEMSMRQEENPAGLTQLAYVYARAGRTEQAIMLIKRLTDAQNQPFVPAYDLAVAYVGLGDREGAFQSLEQAFRERSESLIFLRVDPRLDPIRSDPRYAVMTSRLFSSS